MLTRRRFTLTLMGLGLVGSDRPTGAAAADTTATPGAVSLEGPLSRAVFGALVQESFSVLLANRAPGVLVLLRVDDVARPDRNQFTVVFQGPADLRLSAGTYRVTHATAGTIHLYLRPVAGEGPSSYYEAPFNLVPETAPVMEPPPERSLRRFERPLYSPRP